VEVGRAPDRLFHGEPMTSPHAKKMAAFKVCVIPSDLKEAHRPKELVMQALRRKGFSEQDIFGIKLALEEALTNAVKHGNRNDSTKTVTVRYRVTTRQVVLVVRDEGPGFEPEQVPDCRQPDRLPLPNGRGIMLIRAYMDEVSFCDNGRELYLVKHRFGKASAHD